MVKQVEVEAEERKVNKRSKVNRLDEEPEVLNTDKHTWPSVNAVVYIGHLPHGFYEDQLTSYFSQYGEVLAVKVARSKITARSKGYAFIQFKYHEVADIVSDTMNGYLLLGKVIVSNVLARGQKNPFSYASSGKYKFINWKRQFIKGNKEPKTQEQVAHLVHNMVKNEEKKRVRFAQLGLAYEFPGYASLVPKVEKVKSTKKAKKAK